MIEAGERQQSTDETASPETVSGQNEEAAGQPEAVGGQNKCPKCGSTDITLHIETSMLRCNFCRHEFAPESADDTDSDISSLKGQVVSAGASDIEVGSEDVITLKCTSCGAEVVIDTSQSVGARCHWCRNQLSLTEIIPNGAVPDFVLPFAVKKEDARHEIEKFVKSRQFYAHPIFKKEFCTENVLGVYMPYMIVDINSHATFKGQGEKTLKTYRSGDNTVYDVAVFSVEREFDLYIDDLTIISSSKRRSRDEGRTDNIINAIKPFDTENGVKWDANYLRDFASEKRDANIDDLSQPVTVKAEDIARHNANRTLEQYDRGVRWDMQKLDIRGKQWKASYLPIWLYSYMQKKGSGANLLHYVAVNARSKRTMGSVPVNKPRLFLVSSVVQVIATVLAIFMFFTFLYDIDEGLVIFALLSAGPLYYGYYYNKYRNKKARFHHERDTKSTVTDLRAVDNHIDTRRKVRERTTRGANNTKVNY